MMMKNWKERSVMTTALFLESNSDYPEIYALWKMFCCQCASSAAVERSFSAQALICTPLRNRLDDSKVEMLLSIRWNCEELRRIFGLYRIMDWIREYDKSANSQTGTSNSGWLYALMFVVLLCLEHIMFLWFLCCYSLRKWSRTCRIRTDFCILFRRFFRFFHDSSSFFGGISTSRNVLENGESENPDLEPSFESTSNRFHIYTNHLYEAKLGSQIYYSSFLELISNHSKKLDMSMERKEVE